MSDYILNVKDCLLDVTSHNVRYSFIEIPKELWDDLTTHPNKYIILGYGEKENICLFIDSFRSDWNIKYGKDFALVHPDWIIEYQTYTNKYVINLRYIPSDNIPWLNDIKTLVFKSINSLDNSCLKTKETLLI